MEVGLLLDLLAKGYTPLLAPIALDEEGPLNVNADTAAGAVAGALGWPAVFLTDVEGVYRDPKDPQSRLPHLTPEEVAALREAGVLQGG
ncbi:acetylglutamate/acetylaminoadipate kinase [Thermus thermophilus]|nr:acetylglutamate/acetylaminoadipate kinase [Thermus thermophilus]